MQAQDLACPICDCLVRVPALDDHHAAYCPRCEHRITRYRSHSIDHSLALAFSALLLLLCSTAYPFLGFASSGQLVSMTLLDSATSLLGYGQPLLGGIVFLLVFAAPCALLLALILLLLLLKFGTPGALVARSSLLPWLVRTVEVLTSWNMVEVFLIGVLVSVAKISSMASIQLGYAFWAFIGFTLCTLAGVSILDRVDLWRRVRHLQERLGAVS